MLRCCKMRGRIKSTESSCSSADIDGVIDRSEAPSPIRRFFAGTQLSYTEGDADERFRSRIVGIAAKVKQRRMKRMIDRAVADNKTTQIKTANVRQSECKKRLLTGQRANRACRLIVNKKNTVSINLLKDYYSLLPNDGRNKMC